MKQEYKIGEISGYVFMRSVAPPANLKEVFADAVTEHVNEHANNRLLLFVWATPGPGGKLYCYPISTIDAETALYIAKRLHDLRGFPPSFEWCLRFAYGHGDISKLMT